MSKTEIACFADTCRLGCKSCNFNTFCYECLGNRVIDTVPDNDSCVCKAGETDHYPNSYFCSTCEETHYILVLLNDYKTLEVRF